MGRAEGVTAPLEKDERQDRDKPKEAAEEGDLKAVDLLPQKLDERAQDRKQQRSGNHQQDSADREW